ncbi:MAG: Mur ligase family protein, partial [Flavobacteriales bacterium]
MIFESSKIEVIISGQVVQHGFNHPVRNILLDSRKISHVTDALFIAINGEHHDSHKYLSDVYAAGVRCFIIEQDVDLIALPDANVIRVSSSIVALQQLATHHRKQFAFPTIGITGSNGKTIVKEWLNTMLADDYHIVRSPKSWNSQIGVPLSVLNIESNHTLGIFEAGISQPGEMERLAKVIQPTIGIFTSIGSAHSENFLSRRQLIGEKLNLFAPTEIIICPDDGELAQLISAWSGSKQIVLVPQVERATVGTHNNVTTVRLEWENSAFEFDIPFADRASVENAVTCIHCLFVLKYDAEEIQSRLVRLTPLEMRLQLLDGDGDSVIVNDAYSNDLQSLEIALDFLQQHARGRTKIVILSDILQSGLSEKDLHERINALLQSKNISRLIGVGKSISNNTSSYQITSAFFDSTEHLLEKQSAAELNHCAVLVKGARDFRFERIVSLLQEKTHDTVLEINLNALAHNLNYYRNKLKPETKVMVMVKAFGYGSGAHEVASLLEFNKVDYLAVAYTDEGVALRKAGVSLPIMVLNAEH